MYERDYRPGRPCNVGGRRTQGPKRNTLKHFSTQQWPTLYLWYAICGGIQQTTRISQIRLLIWIQHLDDLVSGGGHNAICCRVGVKFETTPMTYCVLWWLEDLRNDGGYIDKELRANNIQLTAVWQQFYTIRTPRLGYIDARTVKLRC